MSETHQERENSESGTYGTVAGVKLSEERQAEREIVLHAEEAGTPEAEPGLPGEDAKSPHVWFLLAGAVVSFFWVSAVLAFTLGQAGLSGLMALPVTGVASLLFVSVGPAIFVMLAAVLIAELVRFRSTARYIGAMAARFADPAKATREDARLMADAVRSEITRVNGAVEGALARLGAMEEVLGHHSEAFAKAEESARERTDALINDLRREREAVADLAIVLDQKAADIAEAITEQSKMVVAAADIANAHAIDSTKTLEESAERLSGSAHDAAQGAKVIAAKLDEATGRLSSTTIELGDASKALSASTQELDQVRERARDSFAASRDDARVLTDLTRQSVEKMQDVARQGAEIVTEAFDTALTTSQERVLEVQRETRLAAERNARQAEELKNAAEEAKSALDAYAEVIAKRLEQANEASFSAASWADKTFERLEAATKTLESKLAALPETADAQARDLQEKLRKGLEGLNEAARAAADEAEEIDAEFQARIRQNYELLSDFMLRMGAAAGPRGGALDVPSPFKIQAQDEPFKAQTTLPAEPDKTTESVKPAATSPAPAAPKPAKTKKKSFIEAQIEAQNKARAATRDEPAVKTEEPAQKNQGWSWKDVLSGMDRAKDKADGVASASAPSTRQGPDTLDRLVTLFRIHDIDPQSLFSTQTYRSLAHARLVGGKRAMVDIVRLEAEAQIEALSVAFSDDAALLAIAEEFASELRQKINQSAQKGNKLHLETHLRTGDGPAYLLIETALEHIAA
ncbi:MAG: hypothetical protein Q9M33_08740 [Robiginitomaculum sp.]|nr:hypothetical protein [Robiginitomaculum sp.]MDQ7077859.1 hypothetical protein [Robiginitomaculum sp.]